MRDQVDLSFVNHGSATLPLEPQLFSARCSRMLSTAWSPVAGLSCFPTRSSRTTPMHHPQQILEPLWLLRVCTDPAAGCRLLRSVGREHHLVAEHVHAGLCGICLPEHHSVIGETGLLAVRGYAAQRTWVLDQLPGEKQLLLTNRWFFVDCCGAIIPARGSCL